MPRTSAALGDTSINHGPAELPSAVLSITPDNPSDEATAAGAFFLFCFAPGLLAPVWAFLLFRSPRDTNSLNRPEGIGPAASSFSSRRLLLTRMRMLPSRFRPFQAPPFRASSPDMPAPHTASVGEASTSCASPVFNNKSLKPASLNFHFTTSSIHSSLQ